MADVQYGSLREKIAAESRERKARYVQYEAAVATAHEAGLIASKLATPTPMVVEDRRSGQRWHVEGGACGFAWVHIPDGKSSFARWCVKSQIGHKSYRGGVDISARTGDQSMQRNEAYAVAYAQSLRTTLCVEAHADSRID
jgi:hypothetical protein